MSGTENNKAEYVKVKENVLQKADSLYHLGEIYSADSMNQEKALELLGKSLEIYKKNNSKAHIANVYQTIARAYDYLEDYDSVIVYHKKALKLYAETGNKRQEGISSKELGCTYTIIGQFDSAFIYYNKDLELCKIIKDTLEYIELYQNFAVTYSYISDYDKTIEYYLKSLDLCEKQDYKEGICDMCVGISDVYYNNENIEMALKYCNKAQEYIDVIDNMRLKASFYNLCGNIYSYKEDYKKSNEFYTKTLQVSKAVNYKRGIAAAYGNLASNFFEEKKYSEAEKNAILSVNFEKKINHIEGIASSLNILASIYAKQKKYTEAFNTLANSEMICLKQNLTNDLVEVYYQYYDIYKEKSNHDKALFYYEKYYNLSDSIKSIDVVENIANLEIKYETNKKQQKIELLNIENIKKERKLKSRNLFLLSLILLVLIVISVGYSFRQKNIQKIKKMECDIQTYISQLKDIECNKSVKENTTPQQFIKRFDITDREAEILQYICKGFTNSDIAEKIFVSTNTIKFHIKNIYIKLDVKNRVEVINKISPVLL